MGKVVDVLEDAWDKVEEEGNRAYDDFEDGIKGAMSGALLGPWGMMVGFATGSGLAGSAFRDLSNLADAFGLNSLGDEFDRWGSHSDQLGDLMNGDFQKEVDRYNKKKEYVEERQDKVQQRYDELNAEVDALADRLNSLVAFGEIFQLALANRITAKVDEATPELERMREELNVLIDELNALATEIQNNYDFALGLVQTNGFITKFVVSTILIMQGLAQDFKDIVRGQTDGTTWKNFGRAVLAILGLVIGALAIGSGNYAGTKLMLASIAYISSTILVFMMLDGMYAGGIATNGIMSMLDFLFNDILNSDEWISNKMDRLDPDHEDHAKMVMVVQLILIVTALITGYFSTPPNTSNDPTLATGAESYTTTEYLNGAVRITKNADGVIVGGAVGGVSFSALMNTFNAAMSVNDYMKAKESYDKMKDKLEEARIKLNKELEAQLDKRMMGHYRDSAYFLQDQQEYIDRYIWSMTAENMYVDPYGTTPVANIRFSPDKDTRVMSFGFEDVFSESNQAGSKSYFNNIIYGS